MVANNGLYNRVVNLLAKEWGVHASSISPEDRLEDYGDSLTMVALITAFEDEFQVPFPDDIPPPKTVAELVTTVRTLIEDQSQIT